jgi:hypothetical protein
VPFALLFGVVGVVAATAVGLVAGSLYFVVLCNRVADLQQQWVPRRWTLAIALGVVVTVLCELPIVGLRWHGVLPFMLAGLPVPAGLAVATLVGMGPVRKQAVPVAAVSSSGGAR